MSAPHLSARMALPLLSKIRRGFDKPIGVIAYRVNQEARLRILEHTGGWARLERSIRQRWTEDQAAKLFSIRSNAVFHPRGAKALREAAQKGVLDRAALLAAADRVVAREFSLLGAPVPKTGEWPWRTDWRFGHEWPKQPWNSFDHYAKRDRPYDVKYPWELSRLQFLLPLLQAATLENDLSRVDTALDILSSWCAENPFAYSVNWYPMETSMRTICLVMALDMARAAGATVAQQVPLLVEIDRNASLVWRTIEYTDVRGNHYTANLAALLCAGAALSPITPEARRWLAYAEQRMEKEIALQHLPDGVNFEKSLPYHRLVTDLFLLMIGIMRLQDRPVSAEAVDRIRKAAEFTRRYRKPDGSTPIVGDTDDAVVFAMDDLAVNDHRSTLAVAGALFDNASLDSAGGAQPSVAWMSGKVRAVASEKQPPEAWLGEGGFAIVRTPSLYLLADVGEVGMKGRGGHGHNDLLSFELVLNGRTFIVDSGSYLYTGDLKARERYRGTAAHNTLQLDGEEIAPLGAQPFRISPIATPLEPALSETSDTWSISGGHKGYSRLSNPATVRRLWDVSKTLPRVTICDTVDTHGAHNVTRSLHFHPDVELRLQNDHAIAERENQKVRIDWQPGVRATVEQTEVSFSFGQQQAVTVLRLQNDISGATESSLNIEIIE